MDVKKQLQTLNTIAAIVGGVSIVGGAIWFVRNNIWKPRIAVDSVDYDNGVAQLRVNGNPKILYKNATLSAGGVWGVRFNGDNDDKNTRIELVKDDMVHDIII